MTPTIRILQVSKSTGGVAEYINWLIHGLDPVRFKQTVICLSENSQNFANELSQVDGVVAYSFEMNRYRIDPISDLKVFFQLRKIIFNNDFDLIHAHASKSGYLTRLAAIGSGIPVIYSPHCFSFHAGASKLKTSIFVVLERFAARYLTTKFMVVANGEKTLAQKYRVGKPEQFVTIYNSIDITSSIKTPEQTLLKRELGIPNNFLLIGAVGRLNEQKGPLDFIRMAAKVYSKVPDARFVWIGAGPLETDAYQLRQDLGLGDVLSFMGQRSDVEKLLAGMDCFVLPSLWEGFSIVLLEAMAARLPIVATDIFGNDEAIRSGVDGWLVPPGNIEIMAEKVVSIISSPELAIAFANSASQRVHDMFNRKNMLKSVEKLYSEFGIKTPAG